MDLLRRHLVRLTLFGVAFIAASPAVLAVHTSAHAAEQIWEIAADAEQDMDGIVSGFEDQIVGLGTESQVELAEDAADDAIKAIWDQARLSIDDLVRLYPEELGSASGDAKAQLQNVRQASRDLISSLADAWVPPTTTTTTPATTTTPSTTTTTTSPPSTEPPKGSGTSPPGSNNGGSNNGGNSNGGGSNNGGGQPSPPGSETGPGPAPTPNDQPVASNPPDTGPATSASEPSLAAGPFFELTTLTPGQPAASGPENAADFGDSDVASATDRMGALLDAVLPPAIVDLVLSPLLILEILIGTIVDGGIRVIGPLLLLGMFALGIFLYDRSTRRGPFPS
jgi:hypothetical protein